MEKTKLVSVRVPVSVLDAIDRVCSRYPYRNRTDYMIAALQLIVEVDKKGLFDKVIRFHPEFGDVVDEISFEYHRATT